MTRPADMGWPTDLASDVVLPTEMLEPFRLTLEAPMAPELTLP